MKAVTIVPDQVPAAVTMSIHAGVLLMRVGAVFRAAAADSVFHLTLPKGIRFLNGDPLFFMLTSNCVLSYFGCVEYNTSNSVNPEEQTAATAIERTPHHAAAFCFQYP